MVEPGGIAVRDGTRGTRTYEVWDDVPTIAHDGLRKGTQALKTYYDATMKGQDVTEAMMGVLRFYATLDPAIVHRDGHGGGRIPRSPTRRRVAKPLHPEEPSRDLVAGMAWLEGRRPNGDARGNLCTGHHQRFGTCVALRSLAICRSPFLRRR